VQTLIEDSENTTVGHSLGSKSDPSPSYSSRRSVPRYTFVAVAELTENTSQACVMARTAQISRKGCCVDVPNPLSEGTLVSLVISHENGNFATKGKVVYSHQGLGMGIVFLNIANDQLKILDSWLAERTVKESL
jgi:hypothetical protein